MSKIYKPEGSWTEHMVGGPGKVFTKSLITDSADLFHAGRLFAHNVLEKDCGVGYHKHEGEAELYYILSGSAEYTDNGRTVTVSAGDVTWTGPGDSHGIVNRSEEPCEFIALILYEKS